ncbi:MAG: YggS family pyridoxal phosphate-dependent enzyme [Alphaproteobacteria bacterium]|nr:YggS family pyridoxal phosphate-dependent enzyme [Alphaproteobacteria bacterium]
MDDIRHNFGGIEARIKKAAQEAGRAAGDVTLVAVSKVQPQASIQAALDYGHRVFGENRVQEAQEHWQTLKPPYPDLKLHLIGGLQTNKARDAVALFDVIETVDRPKLADALAEAMAKQGRRLPCLMQVNTGEEPQKGGVNPQELEALYKHTQEKAGLLITGLMCIPPVGASPIFHFGLLATWAKRLGLSTLSMGMSEDFEEAIRMGATHVRVGSALFGKRAP